MEKSNVRRMEVPFAQVPNELLTSPNLTGTAKAVWAYMQSKPPEWQFSAARMAQEFKEGRKALLNSLNQLIEQGWLERQKLHNGRIQYTLKIPQSPTGTEGTGHRGKRAPISKKDTSSNKDTSTSSAKGRKTQVVKVTKKKPEKKKTTPKDFNPDGSKIVHAFIAINSACKTFYGNTTQRAACDHLIEDHGLEKVLQVIEKVIPKTNKRPRYEFPHISTPDQLYKGWTRLGDGIVSTQHAKTKGKKLAFTS